MEYFKCTICNKQLNIRLHLYNIFCRKKLRFYIIVQRKNSYNSEYLLILLINTFKIETIQNWNESKAFHKQYQSL